MKKVKGKGEKGGAAVAMRKERGGNARAAGRTPCNHHSVPLILALPAAVLYHSSCEMWLNINPFPVRNEASGARPPEAADRQDLQDLDDSILAGLV